MMIFKYPHSKYLDTKVFRQDYSIASVNYFMFMHKAYVLPVEKSKNVATNTHLNSHIISDSHVHIICV